MITQKELGQYPAILAKHWSITHNTIITIPPMELSSEVEADLAKPTKKTGKVPLCQRLRSLRITLNFIHLDRAYI